MSRHYYFFCFVFVYSNLSLATFTKITLVTKAHQSVYLFSDNHNRQQPNSVRAQYEAIEKIVIHFESKQNVTCHTLVELPATLYAETTEFNGRVLLGGIPSIFLSLTCKNTSWDNCEIRSVINGAIYLTGSGFEYAQKNRDCCYYTKGKKYALAELTFEDVQKEYTQWYTMLNNLKKEYGSKIQEAFDRKLAQSLEGFARLEHLLLRYDINSTDCIIDAVLKLQDPINDVSDKNTCFLCQGYLMELSSPLFELWLYHSVLSNGHHSKLIVMAGADHSDELIGLLCQAEYLYKGCCGDRVNPLATEDFSIVTTAINRITHPYLTVFYDLILDLAS
jgi:hypothetical protein